MNQEKIKQSIAYAADLIDALESDPQLISMMNYAVDVKTLVKCAQNWLMVLNLKQNMLLEHLGDQGGCDDCIDKWMVDGPELQEQYFADTPEEALLKAFAKNEESIDNG